MVGVLVLVVAFEKEDEAALFAAVELRVTRLRFAGGCLEVDGWDSSSDDESDSGAARFLPFRSTDSLMTTPVEADAFECLILWGVGSTMARRATTSGGRDIRLTELAALG